MNYAKPEVTLINSAAVEIQAIPKQKTLAFDAGVYELTQTVNAYEADE